MIDFLSLADFYAFLQLSFAELGVQGSLFAVGGDAALLNQTSRLASGGGQLTGHHQVEDADGTVGQAVGGKLGGGHIGIIAAADEKGMGGLLCLVSLFLSVYQAGELVGQNFLGFVELAAFLLIHLVDLFQRKEGQHADTLENIGIADISPVLEELEGRSFIGIKPYGSGRGFAHFLTFRI